MQGTKEYTHLQADLPLSALLGQLAQVHWPGGQEQVSPHEQADLPLFLAGQFSHVHWPGGHVHSVPHLYCQLSISLDQTSTRWGSLRASSLVVFGGTSLTSALSGWARAFISTTTHQPRFVDRTKGRGHTCKKKLCWSNKIRIHWREWKKTCYRSMKKMLGCSSWSWSCCRSTMIVEYYLKSARHTSGWGGEGWMGGRTTLLLSLFRV